MIVYQNESSKIQRLNNNNFELMYLYFFGIINAIEIVDRMKKI